MRALCLLDNGRLHALLGRLLLAGLLGAAAPAQAASYDFPSAMPAGCSGSNGNYSCGALSLLAADTVTISGTRPATVTVKGNLALNGAKVNQAGKVSDLSLVVQGLLAPGHQAVVNANLVASEVDDANGSVLFGGNIRTTDKRVRLGYRTVVSGSLTTVVGDVVLGDEATVHGHINANDAVQTAWRSAVYGSITAGGSVVIGQENTVSGTISARGSSNITIGYGSQVAGNVTSASGTIDIAQAAVVRACVQVTDGSDPIILGYQAQVSRVCCGSAGSCGSNSCVQNNSTYASPPACSAPAAATLVARYDFAEANYNGSAGELKDTAGAAGGPFHGAGQGTTMPTVASVSPARGGSPGTCSYAALSGPFNGGARFRITSLPVATTAGAKTSVTFWMRWDGGDYTMPLGWGSHSLWFAQGFFGFNSANDDLYGVSTAGLNGQWAHVVAIFTNGGLSNNELWINGVNQTLAPRRGQPLANLSIVGSTLHLGGWGQDGEYRFSGLLDQVRLYNGALTSGQISTLFNETATCPATNSLRHLEIQHASGNGLTCTPSTLTVRACQNADCSQLFTGGVTGTLGATGGTVVWPSGASFSIASGSSSTTINLQATTTTPIVLGVASSTPAASNAATCNFGSPSCTFTAANAGFQFDVPHHRADASQSVQVRAVRKSNNSLDCVPAFANANRSVNFSCSYTNPTTGTLPVRVGGNALNASGSAAAACDSGGRSTSLAFNASGIATTTVQYADAGQIALAATYTGSAGTGDTGLVMTGNDSFIAAPERFSFSGITAGPIKAGSSFAATVTARNANGAATPNFGRETSAETLFTGWARVQPTGSGAANGNFSGGFGGFSGGAANAVNLAWTEVGRGDLLVRSTNAGGYLGSTLLAYGSSMGDVVVCANENSSCVLPGGTTATVYYGERGSWFAKASQTGTVACTNANFGGDPLSGVPKKCLYVATSATKGSVGDFIPHRLTVAATNACGSFSYAGQPIATMVTARNAAGNTTVNFNGTATTTPSFAQAVTLTDANGQGLGALAGAGIAASAFSAGVASAMPSYSFNSKATAPQSLVLRASNGGSGAGLISSQGYTEPTLPLRSGRLRLSNAFGKSGAALQLPVVAEYWGGSAWQLNSADSCTALAGASVGLSNPRGAGGSASTATSSAGALAITAGSGSLTLAAPSPSGSSLSLDLAVNLGSTGTDQSCNGTRPATTGAGLPWLRAQNGSCAATADRDPAARASFGIFAPETRKTVHVRDLY